MAEGRRTKKDRFDEAFERLRERLSTPPGQPGPSEGDGLHLFLHAAADVVEVHRRVPRWATALRRAEWAVEIVSLRELLWKVLDGTGLWPEWVDAAGPRDEEKHGVMAIRAQLGSDTSDRAGLFSTALREIVAKEGERRLVLITEVLALHPWFRAATLPHLLTRSPASRVVVFFPGLRTEPGSLSFLGLHPSETEYRASDIEVAHADSP